MTLISATRAVLCTSRGPSAHLRRTPLLWRVCNVAVVMCRNECHQKTKNNLERKVRTTERRRHQTRETLNLPLSLFFHTQELTFVTDLDLGLFWGSIQYTQPWKRRVVHVKFNAKHARHSKESFTIYTKKGKKYLCFWFFSWNNGIYQGPHFSGLITFQDFFHVFPPNFQI